MTVTAAPATPVARRRRGAFARLIRDPAAVLSGGFLLATLLGAIFAPLLTSFDPYETALAQMLQPPSEAHWLGTDGQGRDILTRILYGTRLTLLLGFTSVFLGGAIGAALGIVSAFYPKSDLVIGRVVDILLSFPAILFGLALAAVMGAGMTAVVVALAIATVPDVARVARSAALVVMRQDFMESGRAVGLSDATLLWRYLARNCASSIFVFATLRLGQVILLGAGLSFLGLGAQPPAAELGMMAAQGRDFLFFAPHVATVPSVMIFAIVLAFNILGDALRDVLDPRLSG